MLTLVGDFGGTNCRLALARGARLEQASQRSYRNDDFDTPRTVLRRYMSEIGQSKVQTVCLGVAGPLQGGRVDLTNYPWTLAADEVGAETGAGRVTLMNDLQAQAYALHGLGDHDLVPLVPGQGAGGDARRLIIAIGTGVNAAVAHRVRGRIFVPPSESGHMALPQMDETDLAFAASLRETLGHQPVEAALSGDGLARLWQFFGGPSGQQGQAVMDAYAKGDEAADAALRRFALYLARYAADLALVHLPMGGVYLAGSVGLAVAPHLERLGFAAAFHRPGPYEAIQRAIPVYAVPKVQLTLTGCATCMA